MKSPASTSDLMSLRMRGNKLDMSRGGEILSPKRSFAGESEITPAHPTPLRSKLVVPTKTLNLLSSTQALQGQQVDSSFTSAAANVNVSVLSQQSGRSGNTSTIIRAGKATPSSGTVPAQHMARFLYSQIDLGSESGSLDRSHYAASNPVKPVTIANYYSLKKTTSGAAILEPVTASNLNSTTASRAISSLLYNNNPHPQSPSKEDRKVNANLRYFTSQITSELPGPKSHVSHTSIHALGKLEERLQREQQKADLFRKDERKVVKNNIFYGSHYQQLEQKYMPTPIQAPSSLKSWQKGIKGLEWNRNPENVHTKKARDFLYYNSTRPY
jgi:hypothetical protein